MQKEECRVSDRTSSELDCDSGEDLIWVVAQILGAVITLALVFLLFRQLIVGAGSTFVTRFAGLIAFCAAIYWLMSWHSRPDPEPNRDSQEGEIREPKL